MCIPDDGENILETKYRKQNGVVLQMADEQLYVIPSIMKRNSTYFGHMISPQSDIGGSTGGEND